MSNLREIVSRFGLPGQATSILPFGSGHIHETFRVSTLAGDREDYLLQRINHHIFKDIPALSRNIRIVTDHIRERLAGENPGRFTMMQVISASDGAGFTGDPEEGYWRMFTFVDGSRSHDGISSPAMAREAGKAYAWFQYLASGIPPEQLTEILPRFHDASDRLMKFRETVRRDPAGRVSGAGQEIAFAETRSEEMQEILRLAWKGALPVRITHNDTKINNVLFDENGEAISVVDLDTVMPGTILYDFGDAIRTGAATAPEDEERPDRMRLDLTLFEGYADGYLGVAKRFLTPVETACLAFSAKMMTWIIGLRFLTDYLDGDRYYRIHDPEHNLRRTRAQFRLLESMEEQYGAMQDIIRRFA